MRQLRVAVSVSSAAAIAVGSVLVATPAFAADAAENYAALGDSYASGVGSREYIEEDCYTSKLGYPQLWADSHDVASFEFAACSGATTEDLNANQLDALSEETTTVTVSIGGNDIGFASVVQDCLLGDYPLCDEAVTEGERQAQEELPAKLQETYANITAGAPNARVVVVGYPRLTDLGDCNIPGFTVEERERLNIGADVLADVISEQASAAGFEFVDTRDAFDGHGVCADDEWINGPSHPLRESFHPKAVGYEQGYLPAINAVTG